MLKFLEQAVCFLPVADIRPRPVSGRFESAFLYPKAPRRPTGIYPPTIGTGYISGASGGLCWLRTFVRDRYLADLNLPFPTRKRLEDQRTHIYRQRKAAKWGSARSPRRRPPASRTSPFRVCRAIRLHRRSTCRAGRPSPDSRSIPSLRTGCNPCGAARRPRRI